MSFKSYLRVCGKCKDYFKTESKSTGKQRRCPSCAIPYTKRFMGKNYFREERI